MKCNTCSKYYDDGTLEDVWIWSFGSCPECLKKINGGIKNMSTLTMKELLVMVASLEKEMGVKIELKVTVANPEVVAKNAKEETEKEKPTSKGGEDKPAPKEEKKKTEKKESTKKIKEEPEETGEIITEDHLNELDDEVARVFEIPDDEEIKDNEDGNAFYEHVCSEFGIESEEDLLDSQFDEVMAMLKFLEENPDEPIESAKRPTAKSTATKKSRRK